MNTRRRLKQAQQDLNETVQALLTSDNNRLHVSGRLLVDFDDWRGLEESYRALQEVQQELDGAAAAAGRDTSIAAARSIKPSGLRLRVLHNLGWAGGLTCQEVEQHLGKPHTSVSSAINYLEEHGLIRDSGERRRTQSGRKAIVWKATDEARRRWLEGD